MKDTDNLDVIGEKLIEDEKFLEFRNQNKPASFEPAMLVANKRSACGEMGEVLKPRIAFL